MHQMRKAKHRSDRRRPVSFQVWRQVAVFGVVRPWLATGGWLVLLLLPVRPSYPPPCTGVPSEG